MDDWPRELTDQEFSLWWSTGQLPNDFPKKEYGPEYDD